MAVLLSASNLTDYVCQIITQVADIQDAISVGANSFLITEYKYMSLFMVRNVVMMNYVAKLVVEIIVLCA